MIKVPNMICNPRRHRRSHPQTTMNAAEILVCKMKGQGIPQISERFRERNGQPCESPHLHPHRQVLPLNKRG